MRIEGTAYRDPATLDVNGDTLTWRAQLASASVLRGPPQPENIVTTVHDVKYARFVELRLSRAGFGVAALGVLWMIRESVVVGIVLLGVALGLFVWRLRKPRAFLMLEMRDRRLVLQVDRKGVANARALVERIDRAIASGEVPDSPPALP